MDGTAVAVEVALFGVAHLGLLVWILSRVVTRQENHEKRITLLEADSKQHGLDIALFKAKELIS